MFTVSILGIQYDSPMNPEEVAKIRQERIKSEKTKVGSHHTLCTVLEK